MEERVPLLPQYTLRNGDGLEERCGVRWWRDLLTREAGKVGCVALPMAAVSVSQSAVQVASNMMIGHLPGVLPLSASAIATSFATVSGFSLLVRFALHTPCLASHDLISFVLNFVIRGWLDKRFTVPPHLSAEFRIPSKSVTTVITESENRRKKELIVDCLQLAYLEGIVFTVPNLISLSNTLGVSMHISTNSSIVFIFFSLCDYLLI